MKRRLITLIRRFLTWTRLGWFPVRIIAGINRGARWTLFPWSAYWRGEHEPEVQQWLASLPILDGKSCWDLGAHFGYYSVAMGRLVGPGGTVAAFEPSEHPFRRLCHHIRLNRLTQIHAFQFGVSDTTGTADFFNADEDTSTTAHLAHAEGERGRIMRRTTIQIVRLDEWVASGRIKAPALVKIDIEGHGHRALAGACETIRSSKPLMMIGLHSRDEREGVLAILGPLGYRATTLTGEPWPITDFIGDALFTPPPRD